MATEIKIQRAETQEIKVPEKKRDRRIRLPHYNDVKMVKGIFRNLEFPGTGVSFPFRGGWKGPIQQYTLYDGGEYEIPEDLATHLNENCAYKTLKWVSTDGTETLSAKPVSCPSMPNFKQGIDRKVHRFMFQITA